MAGNHAEAAKAIEAGRKIKPHDPYLLVVESFYHSSQGNRQEALRALQIALAITGYTPTAETTSVARFLYLYWGNAADVGRLMAFLDAHASHAP
jgi:hypothetical protein